MGLAAWLQVPVVLGIVVAVHVPLGAFSAGDVLGLYALLRLQGPLAEALR